MASNKKNVQDSDVIRLLQAIDSKQDKQTEAIMDIRVSAAKQEAAFEAHLKQDEKMYDKIDDMDQKLGDYNHQLSIHIEGVNQLKRTNELLEEKVSLLKSSVHTRLETLEKPKKFIQELKTRIIKSAKLVTAVATVAGALVWLLKWLQKI